MSNMDTFPFSPLSVASINSMGQKMNELSVLSLYCALVHPPNPNPPCTNSCCKPLLHIIFRLCGAKLERTLWIEPQTESSGQSGCQSVGDFTLTRAHLRAKRRRISDDLQRSSQSNRKALTVTRGVNYTAALSDVLTGCH